jgi:DNA-binding transcriptional MerR regulator/methylmalonyl-CoA mutase cobalamin-binding subunit
MRENDRHRGKHPIRVVALRTGLSPSVLRAWERRYGVVTPTRSEGGQRLYSDADIERLTLLNRATQAGRAISHVAKLDSAELGGLIAEDEAALRGGVASGRNERAGTSRAPQLIDHAALAEALAAVEGMDGDRLEVILKRAILDEGAGGVTEQLLVPLLRQVGDRWQEGTLRPRHEHLATGVLRKVIGWMTDAAEPARDAGRIVIGTPSGERHEIGAMLAAAAAVSQGWEVTFLGCDLPVEDIVGAAREVGADVVGLSIIDPEGAARWGRLVAQIRQQLPENVTVILGGSSARMLGVVLDRPGIERVSNLSEFRALLRSLRVTAAAT